MTYQQLIREALQLPAEEREQMAAALLDSVDQPAHDVEQAWIDEAERRYDEFLRDPSVGIPAKTVHDHIKRKYGWS